MGYRAASLVVCLGLSAGCGDSERWPEPGAQLSAPVPHFPAGFSRRIYVDAGHGAPGNSGNRSAYCVPEQDFTLSLAEELGRVLSATGHFEVKLSRRRGEQVPYAERVAEAERFRAHAFVSLHSDVRGRPEPWMAAPGRQCARSREAPGFALLMSDAGAASLIGARRELARALSQALARTGLLAYDGAEYAPDYELDSHGVFLDRHPPAERIFVLHAPRMASVIIETHNARDDREAQRWEQPETRRAFTAAVAAGLTAALAR